MSRGAILAAAVFLAATSISASAGGIVFGGRGIGIGIGIGPSNHSAEPRREYRPRARTHKEEASRPRRQHRQSVGDEDKKEIATPAKVQENENSSIAALVDKPELENSSIAVAEVPRAPTETATVAVQASEASLQETSGPTALCSRYFPTAGQTMQVPCE